MRSRRLGSGCQAGGWGGRAPLGKRWKAFLPQSREPSVAPAGLSWPPMLPGPCLSPSGNAASYNLCQGGRCSAPFITMVMVMFPAGAPSLLADRMCEPVHWATREVSPGEQGKGWGSLLAPSYWSGSSPVSSPSPRRSLTLSWPLVGPSKSGPHPLKNSLVLPSSVCDSDSPSPFLRASPSPGCAA